MLSWLLPASLLRQDGVFALAYWFAGAAFLLVEAAAVVFLVRTRPRRAVAAQEAAWALVPVVMLVALGVLGTRARIQSGVAPAAATKALRDR